MYLALSFLGLPAWAWLPIASIVFAAVFYALDRGISRAMGRNRASLFAPLALLPLLVVMVLVSSSCALIRPGDDPVVVRTQDVISNSFDAWDAAMDLHAANSTRESPQVYAAAEKIRTGFPPLHRALRNALKGYQGATTKDPEKLRLAVLGILGDMESLATPGSKFAQTVALIRASYLGGGA